MHLIACVYLWLSWFRQGLRVHYPSQTSAPSRGFPDFLLRAPAASVAEPESGSTSEVSESDEEDQAAQGRGEGTTVSAALPADPLQPALQLNPSQHAQPQDTESVGKSGHSVTFTSSHQCNAEL